MEYDHAPAGTDDFAIYTETDTRGGDASDPKPEHVVDTLDVSLSRCSTTSGGSKFVYNKWELDNGCVARKANPMAMPPLRTRSPRPSASASTSSSCARFRTSLASMSLSTRVMDYCTDYYLLS